MRKQDAGLLIGTLLGGSIALLIVGILMSAGVGLSGGAIVILAIIVGVVALAALLLLGRKYIWDRSR